MSYLSVKKHQVFKTNPFVDKAIQDIKIVRKTQVVRATDRSEINLIVNADGEVEGHSQFLRFVEVDEEKFAKLYLSQFAAFWELSKPAIRVLGYILSTIQPKKDSFIFKLEDCLEHTKYVHVKDVNTGLAGLLECKIIARTPYDFEYFINPMIVFNGDRVSFAKTYIKKRKMLNPNQIDMFSDGENNFESKETPLTD